MDNEETQNLEDMQAQAKNELEEWYNRHQEQLNQTKGLNRSEQYLLLIVTVLFSSLTKRSKKTTSCTCSQFTNLQSI